MNGLNKPWYSLYVLRIWKRMSLDANLNFIFLLCLQKVGKHISRFWPALVVCIFSLTVALFIKSGVSTNRFSSWCVHGVRNDKISQPILWLSFPACCSVWVLWVQFSRGPISTFIIHTHRCGYEIVWPTIFHGFRFNAGGHERILSSGWIDLPVHVASYLCDVRSPFVRRRNNHNCLLLFS